MYIVTGANGFIGSVLVGYLNSLGIRDLLLVDDFVHYHDKTPNLDGKEYLVKIERDTLFAIWDQEQWPLEGVFHLGARTDTTETDTALFDRLNRNYSREVWRRCADLRIPLVYASSAATYGSGEEGFSDGTPPDALQPLNEYGRSKNDFDSWALRQSHAPPHWYGLKFFNVYGPNEYHKGRMASVVWHTFRQVRATERMKLFRSHRKDIPDGEQQRDFIYVLDLCRVCHWLMTELPEENGLFNLGTGQARTFLDLARATFTAMDRPADVQFIDTPADLRPNYQYFTQADMGKLRRAGYSTAFTTLEEGVADYVRQYLLPAKYY
ncbi:ADP-glyceromanno-heptose 6-epimerase [Neolewinella litorea]|uniref:ADP-L-glycero-D-manno-heptose-6-epimerase n=1 Tax=Neolewinella litorea TaxID=2562452 RepID=A0A4S4NMJ0_9BACT|nr:ADP-glyceromanno-heptose 6-epimerase [Neolewinella litorea]THH41149.1 ADP-glyceromanno-heptose 6-epimerase [Neolewinella litorea]